MSNNLEIYSTSSKDYEFIGLRYNDKHCEELGLLMVPPSDFYQEEFFGEFEDTTLEVPGREGAYYFGTQIRSKRIAISFAFDDMNSRKRKEVMTWLDPRKTAKLIFDSSPYKYQWVKVAAQPSFSYVPFESEITNGVEHIFKGTLDVEFLAVDPYSYSDYALIGDVPIWNESADTWLTNKPYSASNLPGWLDESGLFSAAPSTPAPLAFANGANGYTNASVSGTLPVNFYNGGSASSVMDFSFTVSVFSDPQVLTIANGLETFELASLRNIKALANQSTGTWTISYTANKGILLGYSSTTEQFYNLGAIWRGVLPRAHPGDNTLSFNRTVTGLTIKYKYKYW